MWPSFSTCGTALARKTHIVEECEIHKKERNVLEKDTRKFDQCDMEKIGRLESAKTTTANLGNSWWPQTGKQEGDDKSKLFNAIYWKILVNA